MSDLRQAAQQVLDAWQTSLYGKPSHQKAVVLAMTNLNIVLQQQAEPVAQRSDGMPISKMERELRRMLCIERHGRSAYMDDGEASFCGDKYCRSIDYMRESVESIKQAWYDAGVKKLAGAQPEQQAEPCQYCGLSECDPKCMWIEQAPQQQAEPVAWTLTKTLNKRETTTRAYLWFSNPQNYLWTPLYTAPPQRKPLTDEEIRPMCKESWVFETVKQWVRIVEAAHGIQEPKQ